MNTRDTDEADVKSYGKTILQQYFEDVGFVYDKNDNDCNLEYCEENRDKLIEMNLKCVIKIAKAFRGMGLSLEELISAGNEGLCIAFDKFDPNRNIYREEILEELDGMDVVSRSWIENRIGEYCQYGKLRKKYVDAFEKNPKQSYTKKEVLKWIKVNMKKASFNSVAMLWVTAAIRQELDNCSRLVRKPKMEIEKEKTGESQKESYIDINAPVGDDGNNTISDVLDVQEEDVSDIDIEETHQAFHDLLRQLFVGIKMRDKRILLQRFGVGYVRPMLPKEISEREQISVARVSQIINLTIQKIQENAKKQNINPENVFQMIEKTNLVL